MCLDDGVGQVAISALSAAGNDPREGTAFLAAQAEIDKLNSINSRSVVDWERVAESSVKVLSEEGKDLSAAVWLLCAWCSLHGVVGLVAGVHVLRDLVEGYWSDFTPPLSRLRARRSQINWLLDWLDAKLAAGFTPIVQQQLARLLVDWDEMDRIWCELDAEGPSFFRLRQRLAELAVESVEEPQLVLVEANFPNDTERGLAFAAVDVREAVVAQPVVPDVHMQGSESEVLERVLESNFSALRSVIGPGLQGLILPSLLFRVNRQTAWISLEEAPPSQAGMTLIPAPARSEAEVFAQVQAAGDELGIVRFCEGKLLTYPHWLDLNRVSHAALSRLGAKGAAAAASLALEVRHLLARLPELAELKYADGQPFADGATRTWLEALEPVICVGVDSVQELIDSAVREAAGGELDAALQCLQERLGTFASGRDRFRLRRAQCELLHRFDPRAPLRVVLDVLLREAQAQALDRWEPELVQPLLELTLLYRDIGSRDMWSEQLAAMDLPVFWRLAGARLGSDS